MEQSVLENYSTKELSPKTWPDFEKLFGKYDGVQAGCWCMYYQRSSPLRGLSFNERTKRNHDDKKKLVKCDMSHGILVYDLKSEEAVGWCEYGLMEELPRFDAGRNYRKLGLSKKDGIKMWRIACFFVDKSYRRSGVARIALHAALSSIRKNGAG